MSCSRSRKPRNQELHMSDSLRNDETLTTADIARRPTARQVRSEVLYRGPVPVENAANNDAERIAPDTQAVQVPSTNRPNGDPASTNTPAQASNASGPLFPDDELHNLRARWDQAQTSFVDEPRRAVEQADSLVA